MTTLNEIKKLIEESENPLFFYDDDPDGLVSYLLLRRYFKKGEGIIIKIRSENLNEEEFYSNKIERYSPDLVVFLDKPTLTQEIFDKIHVKKIWIDHHTPVRVKGVVYYNPRLKNKRNNKPVSYICYQITKQDLWLAAVGVTADWNTSLVKSFRRIYPGLVKLKSEKPDEVLYETKLGELARRFSFILKGKTSEVRKAVSLVLKIENPEEILEKRSENGKELFEISERFKRQYERLLEKALEENKRNKMIIFRYISKISFTADLANELIHKYPKKIIIVARETGYEELRISLRSGEKGVELPPILEKVLMEIKGRGGGHEHAAACMINKEDFKKFIELIKKNAKK